MLESSSVPLTHSFPPSPSVHMHLHLPCPCPPSLSAALVGCVCQVDRSDISQLEALATRLHTYDDFRTQVRRQGGGGDGTPHVAHWCPVPLLVARDCCEGCRSSCPALWLVVTIIHTRCLAPPSCSCFIFHHPSYGLDVCMCAQTNAALRQLDVAHRATRALADEHTTAIQV